MPRFDARSRDSLRFRSRASLLFLSILPLLAKLTTGNHPDHHAVHVLLFGDSLTAGYWNDGKNWHPYADRLEALLDCPVSYVGLSGWTTDQLVKERNASNLGLDTKGRAEHGLEKMLVDALARRCHHGTPRAGSAESQPPPPARADEPALAPPQREGNPFTHVAILAGTNDMYMVHETGHQKIIDNLKTLHATAHHRGASTLALTVPQEPLSLWIPSQHVLDPSHEALKKGRDAVNEWLKKYAEEKASSPTSVRVVDVENALPMHGIPDDVKARRWEKDGIHFTPFGSDELANAVFDALAQDRRVQRFCNTKAARKEMLPMGGTRYKHGRRSLLQAALGEREEDSPWGGRAGGAAAAAAAR